MKLAIVLAFVAMGCAHNVEPPKMAEAGGGPPNRTDYLPPLPAPAPVVVQAPAVTPIHLTEEPCGHSLTVKVGELDVDMPHGGSLDIAGVKGETKAYHITLKGVEFINTEHCLTP